MGAVYLAVGIRAWHQRPRNLVGLLMMAVGLGWLSYLGLVGVAGLVCLGAFLRQRAESDDSLAALVDSACARAQKVLDAGLPPSGRDTSSRIR